MGKATAIKAKPPAKPKSSEPSRKSTPKAKANAKTKTDKSKEKDLASEEDSIQGQKFWSGYKKLCDSNKQAFESDTHLQYMKQLQKASYGLVQCFFYSSG